MDIAEPGVPSLNILKTSLMLVFGFFLASYTFSFVLTLVGISLHPLGLVLVWLAICLAVARRISRSISTPPPATHCAIALLVASAVYSMVALAALLKTTGFGAGEGLVKIAPFSALLMVSGLVTFLTTFHYSYKT